MLRPLILDLLSLLLPLAVGALAFWAGWSFRRWPRALRIAYLVLTVVVAAGVSWAVGLFPDTLGWLVSWVGGAIALFTWIALLVLGVVWATPGRRLSSPFLACLVGLAGCLLLIEGSGPLWW